MFLALVWCLLAHTDVILAKHYTAINFISYTETLSTKQMTTLD